MRQIFGDIGWEKKVLVFFGTMAILIIIGPFGTYDDLDFWQRSVFWVIIVGGVGFGMHITMSVSLTTRAFGNLGQVLRLLIGAAVGAFPGAAIVVFVNGVFRSTSISAETMPVIWMQVTVIGFIVGSVEYIDWRRFRSANVEVPKVKTKLHARLNAGANGEIISMSMQDHYVEVTTDFGKELVLLRFTDALSEITGITGTRIHRSHWVADSHLIKIEKRGNRTFVMLSDGRELPVSDTYSPAVRESIGV